MNNYRQLAVKYLKLNKKRSVNTMLGVSVTVMILYIILNLSVCALMMEQKRIRQEQDYEIVFLSENQMQIEQIMSDSKVKSASIGTYYEYDYNKPVTYENALYVNTTNPYRMEKIKAELEEQYGVQGILNAPLAATYMQESDGGGYVIMALVILIVCLVFAIFGVGIVRNSIQLSTLEQIKDYGNMRCIGATKGQLRTVIYMEGVLLEAVGNIVGVVLGLLASYIIGFFIKWDIGFHILPAVLIFAAFLFDLYFVMEENCKVVTNMTPVSAIRGEFRIRKEKIKLRKSGLFGKVFGVEGDYAYKNIMRNPGRFWRTVWALGLAVAAFISLMGIINGVEYFAKQMEEEHKYYQVYFENSLDMYESYDEVASNLPPADTLEKVRDMKGVTEAKRIFATNTLLADWEDMVSHYTENYREDSSRSWILDNYNGGSDEEKKSLIVGQLALLECYGYDENDYAKYEDLLVDGTMELSENGILLVNGGNLEMVYEDGLEDTSGIFQNRQYVTYTDYQVGDTIDVVDPKKLRERVQKKTESLTDEYEKERETLRKQMAEKEGTEASDMTFSNSLWNLDNEYYDKKQQITEECRQELVAEGEYTSYVIEGILKDDALHMNTGVPRVILPLEKYFEFTETDESMVCGMQYHFENFSSKEYEEATDMNYMEEGIYYVSPYDYRESTYFGFRYLIDSYNKVGIVIGLVILFVVLMSTLNIANTTASNLHSRRKELAQLRVIGVSKTHLMKMVLLEGVISSIAASMIGIIIGVLLSKFVFELFVGLLFGVDYHFSIMAAVVAVVMSTTILCGAVYSGLKGLKQDVASDLALGGD